MPSDEQLSFSPKSSHVRTVTYSPSTKTLSLTFHNGATYTHGGVPQIIFSSMQLRRSAGAYYKNSIASRYKIISVDKPA